MNTAGKLPATDAFAHASELVGVVLQANSIEHRAICQW